VNYKTFLNKDYKNIVPSNAHRRPRRLRSQHLLIFGSIAVISAVIFTFVSLDARAKKHVASVGQDPANRIVLSIDIPESQLGTTDLATAPEQVVAENWITAKVKKGDSLAAIFQRHDLAARDLHQIMSLGKDTKRLRKVQPGQHFRIRLDQERQVQTLQYKINKLETLSIQREGNTFVTSLQHKDVEIRTHHSAAKIKSSLFEAGRDAGLSDSLTMDLAHIFGWDIDFVLDIRQGDQFTVLYEEHFLDGLKLRDGAILAAEFINQGKSYKAIRYTDAENRSDYYSPEGLSMRKAFLRTPVDFRRISSRFGKRKHPVLNRIRMHKGVDYAAPRGTPIKSSGDGKIVHKGRKGGYGRTIIIKHGGRYSTLYAHMSSYKRGIRVGKRVKQGQTIGYVGSSGRTTGPHLHYEFRVNGVHRNPLTIRLPHAKPINKKYKQDFALHAQTLIEKINMYKETNVALNN